MSSPDGAYVLPDSFDDGARQCGANILTALDAGVAKMRIDFDTSAGDITYTTLRNSLPIARTLMLMLAEKLCVEANGQPAGKLQMLMPDEGTAALVAREWAPPPTVHCASIARYRVPEDAVACIVVAPTSLDTGALDALLNSEPVMSGNVPVIVLNPQLVNMNTGALGLEGRQMLKRMASEFPDVFVLQTLPGAAITRKYPDKYAIWQEDPEAPGGFRFVRDDPKRPSAFAISEELYEDTETPGWLKELKSLINSLQRL
ncbi:hypothetical protein T492DRAFT_1039452 [Pavlovales sp. CCMP2436]|nr:hypothetical protein T492DRAFT_1039452 [Pavlovales sp. CCMP2436]